VIAKRIDEELMVVALTGGLRVEQPFTKDRGVVVDTLRRMEHDISLWNGNFGHLTEEAHRNQRPGLAGIDLARHLMVSMREHEWRIQACDNQGLARF
jgi:hypothetical protein